MENALGGFQDVIVELEAGVTLCNPAYADSPLCSFEFMEHVQPGVDRLVWDVKLFDRFLHLSVEYCYKTKRQ